MISHFKSTARILICILFFNVSMVFSSVMPAESQSLESYTLDARIWTGEITIERIGAAYVERDNGHTNAAVIRTYHESRQTYDKWRIKACGEAGNLHILAVKAELSENSEIRSTFKERSRDCNVKKPDLKKPGNFGRSTEIGRVSRYEGPDCPPLEKQFTVQLMVWPGGRYRLWVNGYAYASNQLDKSEYEKFVCDGHTKKVEFHQQTIGINEKARSTTRDEGDGDNVHSIQTSLTPATKVPAGFGFEGKLKGGSIADSMPISEIKAKTKGGYHEKTTASWTFTARNPCEMVYQRLMQDLAWAEAYADTKLRDFYDNNEDYKKAVNLRAQKNYSGAFPAGGNGGHNDDKTEDDKTETEMTTNCNCEIEKEEAFKEKVKRECRPYILFKAVKQHEKRHVAQCLSQGRQVFCGKSPNIVGPNEVDAHIAGMKQYLSWLKENCPNYDTTAVKKRIKELKKEIPWN